MNKKKILQRVIDLIKSHGIDVNHEYDTQQILINKRIGSYLIEFVLKYSIIPHLVISQDYYHPQESEIEFVNEKIEDLNIYLNNEIIEFDDDEIDKIQEAIEELILN